MPNRSYANSTRRELQIKKELEKEGWFAIRSSGSHGIADVVAVRPAPGCVDPSHYEVKFIQVKTSQSLKERKVSVSSEETACGYVNVEFHSFPVKNKVFFEEQRKRKEKKASKK